jgi:bifunctional DNA-binding transcriptional regulator/antitoxin component of YhaV-PrlF toxin-antitoxin module
MTDNYINHLNKDFEMKSHQVLPSIIVHSVVNERGQLVLEDLPFVPGDTVEIIVRGRVIAAKLPESKSIELSLEQRYPLQGSQPYTYADPFESAVPAEDWEVLQ